MIDTKRVSVEYRVPYADTDKMSYVYYANYLAYFERGRNELMRAWGFSYKALEDLGIGLPVIESHVTYKVPAKYDDVVTIVSWLSEIKGLRVTVSCKVLRNGVLLAEGYTKHAFMSLETGKPVRIPADIREKFEAWKA